MAKKGNRPTGVTILAILNILGGLLFLLAAAGSAFAGPFISAALPSSMLSHASSILGIIGLFLAVLGIIFLIVGYGLWKGMNWAWWLSVILLALGVIANGLSLLSANISAILPFIIGAIILYYVTRPRVKSYFGMR